MSQSNPYGSSGDPAAAAGRLDHNVAVSLLQRAQALAEQGDYQLAAQTYQRVVGNEDPTIHVAALLGLAEAQYRMDNEPAAIQQWLVATQAPETPLTWLAWKSLAAARVRLGDIPGAARAYREAERRAPASERAEIASRLGWLNKEMGNTGSSQRYFARSRTSGIAQPVVTYGIIAVTVVIGLLEIFGPPSLAGQHGFFVREFALTRQGIENGQYWRLLTVVLVHDWTSVLPLHLLFNMYALWIVGPLVETLYGKVRYLFIYLACGAAGSAASFVFSNASISVGASGAIFGLFSALLVANIVHKPLLTRNARMLSSQIGLLIVINLVIGLAIPNIDMAAHVGGLLAGAWLGLVIPPTSPTLSSMWQPKPGSTPSDLRPTINALVVQGLGVLALLAVIAAGVSIGPIGPIA